MSCTKIPHNQRINYIPIPIQINNSKNSTEVKENQVHTEYPNKTPYNSFIIQLSFTRHNIHPVSKIVTILETERLLANLNIP